MDENNNGINKHLKDLELQYGTQDVREPFKAYRETRNSFPVNLVLKILLILACLTFLFDRYQDQLITLLPQSRQYQVKSFVQKNLMPHNPDQLVRQPVLPATAANAPTAAAGFVDGQSALPKDANPDEFVQIYSRYYKKTHDKIYIINGNRVFFDDNLTQERMKSLPQNGTTPPAH